MSGEKIPVSKVSDRTFEMCVPSDRCMPLHSIHSRTPRLIEHQSTLLSELQSAQTLLPSSALRTRWRSSDGSGSVPILSVRLYEGLSPVVAYLLTAFEASARFGLEI